MSVDPETPNIGESVAEELSHHAAEIALILAKVDPEERGELVDKLKVELSGSELVITDLHEDADEPRGAVTKRTRWQVDRDTILRGRFGRPGWSRGSGFIGR